MTEAEKSVKLPDETLQQATGGSHVSADAGIGGGRIGHGSNVSITGDTVTAQGGDHAAGIGGGVPDGMIWLDD